MPGLYGAYVFADMSTGVFALRYDEGGGIESLGTWMPEMPSSFGVDVEGELYLLGFFYEGGDNKVYKLVDAAEAFPKDFPRTLSATHCFESLKPLRVVDGVTPYGVNIEQWSDGVLHEHYFALPAGGYLELNGFTRTAIV